MHRALLIQCLPALVALGVSFLALGLLVRFSGAKWNWRRLGELHRCQDGGVQSLSFVLTLPLFLVFVMFIVQVSQLMIGLVTVNYAAFAAARAASVWIPAEVRDSRFDPEMQEHQNRFLTGLPVGSSDPAERLTMLPFEPTMSAQLQSSNRSQKYSRIRTAAVMGCAPIAPSRDIRSTSRDMTQASRNAVYATQLIYGQMVSNSSNNSRINPRLENKIRYADRNTLVFVEWRDARRGPGASDTDSRLGPSYNPANSPAVEFDPYQVGWQDPVTVFVVHRFALFPGPGHLVANLLIRPVGVPPRIRQMIPAAWQASYIAESETYSVLIPAAATLPAEGIQSTRPYVQ